MTDFEWTVYNDIIFSREIATGLRDAGFSGADFVPAKIFSTTETPIGREAFELKVCGWGGTAPPESGVRIIEECPVCMRHVFSESVDVTKLFGIDGWDGSDFFVIWPLPRYVMVTEAVRSYILNEDYSGVKARPLAELPRSLSGTLTPGHLHDWFDEERVAEILSMNKRK